MDARLVILAGGLGSRFGGDKAFTSFGPRGELLLEFTLFDARRAGIEVAVLVVPPGAAAAIAAELEPRVVGVELRFVEQDRGRPYADLDTPARERPWGTAHAAAIGCDGGAERCVIVNADDWYGPRAITDLAARELAGDAALVTWPLAATLSEHGPVNRGLCVVRESRLASIVECVGIARDADAIRGRCEGEAIELDPDAPISLNCWALRRPAIDWLRQSTRSFIHDHRDDPRIEAQLPTILEQGLEAGALTIHAHAIGREWAGVTFAADASRLRRRLAEATAAGHYPSPLWPSPLWPSPLWSKPSS